MLTREYISWLLMTTGNQLTRQELLTQVNIAQNMIFAQPGYFNRTKPDPFLTTYDGVYEYILPANVKVVSRVYALASNNNFMSLYPQYGRYGYKGSYKQPVALNNYSSPEINITIDTIQSISPDSQGATIIFPNQFNPKDTTDVFLIEQYEWPVQLTSEDIPLSVPEEHQFGYLYYIILRFLEEQGYGNSIYNKERADYARQEWMRDSAMGAKSSYARTLPKDV